MQGTNPLSGGIRKGRKLCISAEVILNGFSIVTLVTHVWFDARCRSRVSVNMLVRRYMISEAETAVRLRCNY